MSENHNAKPWTLKKLVLPQHTDHAGVLWHGSHIGFLEEARVDALSKVGVSYAQLAAIGYEMPVVTMQIEYLQSLNHGQIVVLESWPLARNGVRWPWSTNFLRDGKVLVAKANVDLVLVKKMGNGFRALRKLPDELELAFVHLQQGPGLNIEKDK